MIGLAAPAPVTHPGRGDLLDLVLLALAARALFLGARRGLVVAACSAVGFFGGAVVGAKIGPGLAQAVAGHGSGANAVGSSRVVTLVVVGVAAIAGEVAAVTIGARVRTVLRATPVAVLDSAGGAVFEASVFLLVAWLLSSAVALAPFDGLSSQVRRSAVLHGIDSIIPDRVRSLSANLGRELQQHAMPYFVSPFGGFPSPSPFVGAPDAGPVPKVLGSAGSSVVKIRGTAPSCSRAVEGSGFVYADEHVMTNAHVVAGVRQASVLVPNGGTLSAKVVLFDPDRDVAVLYVPGLNRKVLPFASALDVGADAVVAGYPEDGPLTAVPARVAGQQDVDGPNIYQSKRVSREVYTLRAKVLPGNSGGPLLTTTGTVAGVVFAASLDAKDVGYALTAGEVASDARSGRDATTPVSTHGCD